MCYSNKLTGHRMIKQEEFLHDPVIYNIGFLCFFSPDSSYFSFILFYFILFYFIYLFIYFA